MKAVESLAREFEGTLPFELDAFQREAIDKLDSGEGGVLVSAPTSSGKTVVAEYAIFRARRDGTKVASLNATSWTDSGLATATSYTYTVTAHDAAGNVSGPATTVGQTAADTQAPSGRSTMEDIIGKVGYEGLDTFAEDGEATTNTHEAGQRLSNAWKKTMQREGKMIKEGSSLSDLMSARQEQTGVKGGNQEVPQPQQEE